MSADPTQRGPRSRTSGGVVLLFALAYLAETIRFEVGYAADPIGPRAFPLLLGGAMLALGAWLLARPGEPAAPRDASSGRRVLAALSLFLIYPLVLSWVGFIVATTSALGGLSVALGASRSRAAASSLALSLALYLLCRYAFSLALPDGRLFQGLLS